MSYRVTQRNIEAEENKALKKEELKEKIRRSNSLFFNPTTPENSMAKLIFAVEHACLSW